MNWITRHLLSQARPNDVDGSDESLLAAFSERRDEAAFATLVRRYGPMVWGVCRRATATPEDAEDTFQAVFLILARKAATIAPRSMLAGWLHGVVCRAAWQTRRGVTRRRAVEQPVARVPEPHPPHPVTEPDPDLTRVIDQEIGRLPEHYRLPVLLCLVQGLTRKEAAIRLGWPEGSVAGRLDRGRKLLVARLSRRGVASVAGAGLGTLFNSAAMPAALVSVAIRTGTGTNPVPMNVLLLTEKVIKAMSPIPTKWLAAVILAAGVALTGATLSGQNPLPKLSEQPAAQPAKVPPPSPVKSDPNPAIEKLQKERLDALKKLADGLERQYRADPAATRLSEVLASRQQVVEAELELCRTSRARGVILAEWRQWAEKLEADVGRAWQARKVSELDVLAVRAKRLEAEIAWQRHAPKEPDRVGRIILTKSANIPDETNVSDEKICELLLPLAPGAILPYPELEKARTRLSQAFPAMLVELSVVPNGSPDSSFMDIEVKMRLLER